jgi:hypothetical protein
MQRKTTIFVGLGFVVVVALLASLSRSRGGDAKPGSSAASGAHAPASSPVPSVSTLPEALPEPSQNPDLITTPGFDILPDGSKAPPLPEGAPQSVRFGVILIRYKGAQSSHDQTRTKDQAKQRAESLIAEAKKDFAAAAAKGDRGSTADAGRIERGILEAAPEYVLFTLGKGAVSEQPVDTPVGYWVVRRIE